MNILTSYNWLKEYLDTDLHAEEFAKLTTDAGNSVEYLFDLEKRYANMVVGRVLEVNEHPNADKLKVAKTDIGEKQVEIVCGGANLADGQLVAVALPGSSVRWHGEEEWTKLEAAKIRGVESFGMICAAEELGFDQLPQGKDDIWDLSEIVEAKPGTPLAQALELDDVLFDIEVTSNRPDCASIVGQAREGGAVTKDDFTFKPPELSGVKGDLPDVTIEDYKRCKKYNAIVLEGIEVKPSPWWLQKRLLLAGMKPVNNIVDITNYVLHEYGQPLHAFDADKLKGEKIVVRPAKKGEKIVALDNNEYELSDDMLVIADQQRPVAIAGIMGGKETGTTEETTRILLESATFDAVSVRRTSRDLVLSSNSSQLFKRHLSTQATEPALARAVALIKQLAGGTIASSLFTDQATPYETPVFPFDPQDTNALMGVEVADERQIGMLERLGFSLSKKQDGYTASVPYWRDNDITGSRDFIEEIARLYGYENIPSSLPVGDLSSAQSDPTFAWIARTKQALKAAGLTEVYNMSFISKQALLSCGMDPAQAVRLENPLSEEEAFMRPALIPSILSAIEQNQGHHPTGCIFELAPVYLPNGSSLPKQQLRLVSALYGTDGYEQFRQAKGILERLFDQLGIDEWHLVRQSPDGWHPGRTAFVHVGEGSDAVGRIGEVSDKIQAAFKIDERVTCIALDFDSLMQHMRMQQSYEPIPQYQDVRRDIAFVVNESVAVGEVTKHMKETSPLLKSLSLFDVYRGDNVGDKEKSLAMHLSFRSPDKTLKATEVDKEMDKLRQMLEKQFDAILRS